jgi:hypothetical protein
MGQSDDQSEYIPRNPEEKLHEKVSSFANGNGPILSRADQHMALQDPHKGRDTAHKHLPSNEDLLGQLRIDAKGFESNVPKSLTGFNMPKNAEQLLKTVEGIQDGERDIAKKMEQVKNYSPQQLKDIGDIANAVHNPLHMKEVMKRFDDPAKLAELQSGLHLEMERRGGKVDLISTMNESGTGGTKALLLVRDPKSGQCQIYEGPVKKSGSTTKNRGAAEMEA